MSANNNEKTPTLSWSQPPVSAAKPIVTKPPMTTTPPVMYGRNAIVVAFVGGVVLGTLFSWLLFGQKTKAPTPTVESAKTTTTKSSGTTPVSDATSGLRAASQAAGLSVAVSGVEVSKPTWVVVYDNRGGEPGSILGARLFFPTSQGGVTSGTVSLLRATEGKQTYFLGEFIDNGDKKFSTKSDTRVMENDEPLLVSFTTK